MKKEKSFSERYRLSGSRSSAVILLTVITFILLLFHDSRAQVQQVKEKPNLNEIRKQFADSRKDRPVTKGSGYNPFKRWEWYWEPRVNPDGNFPPNNVLSKEWERWSAENATDNTYGNWTPMGPVAPISRYFGLGRVSCIAFHPTIASTFWIGTPAGGLWRTDDFGQNWTNLLDGQPVLGVSDIVVDRNNPLLIYIATGDADGGGVSSITQINNTGSGDTKSIGILKSVNGGQSWQKTGFSFEASAEKLINRLIQHPTNPKVLFAATTAGLFRSSNSGTKWDTLKPDPRLIRNYSDIAFKPGDTNVIYAADHTDVNKWSTVYRSVNGGQSWDELKQFSDTAYRIKLAVSVKEPNILEAICVNDKGGLRSVIRFVFSGTGFSTENVVAVKKDCSNNYLNSWKNPLKPDDGSAAEPCTGQGEFDLFYAIDPVNKDVRYLGGVNTWKSTDRGKTFNLANYWYEADPLKTYEEAHADKHWFAFHPLQQGTMFECNDGGIYYSRNGGLNWTDISKGLQIGQIYRIAGSWEEESLLLAGLQDNGSQVKGDKAKNKDWWSTVQIGGDGMACLIDWVDPLVRYTAYLNGTINRTLKGDWSDNKNISANITQAKIGAWVTPYVMNSVNSRILYAGFNRIWRTGNRGDTLTWSPVMSIPRSDKDTLFRTMAISEYDTSVMWASSATRIYKTSNAWKTWDTVRRGNLPPLAKGYYLTGIAIHPTKPNTVFVTFSTYDTTNMKVYRTENGGSTWTNLTGKGLPKVPVNCIAYEAFTDDALYIGTDLGVYYRNNSLPDWIPFNSGLPNVTVTDLAIAYGAGKIRASTFGRGLWESDLYVPSGEYKVNVKDVPKDGGNVTGGGMYISGSKARVKATVEPGYRFLGWFENTNKLSDSLNYEFDVNENHNLIANFGYPQSIAYQFKDKITVTPNPGSGLIQLTMDSGTRKSLSTIRVITYSGTLVYESAGIPSGGPLQVDLRDRPDGMYLLTFYFNSGEHVTYSVMIRK